MKQTSKVPRRKFSRAEKLVLIAFGMIVVQLIFRGWAVAGSWFYSDDFIFLGDVGAGNAGTSWLFHMHNVHFMPVGLLLAKLVGTFGTFSWSLAASEILLMQAIASFLCWWMLRTLFGDRKGILFALGFYLFGALSFPTVVWWAASLNQLPQQIAIFGAIGAHTLYVRRRHASALTLSIFFVAFGLASYSKSILIPLVLFTLTATYFVGGRFVPRLKSTITRFWPAWLAYGAMAVGYLVMYVIRAPSTKTPPFSEILGTLNVSFTDSFAAAVMGGPWHWQDLTLAGGIGPRLFVATPAFFVMLSWLAIFLAWAYAILKYRYAWRPILIVGPYLVLSAVLIAIGRAGPFGIGPAALELRYLADLAGIGALCIALAVMPVVGAKDRLAPRSPAILTLRFPRWMPAAVAIVFVVGATFSSISYAQPWHSPKEMPQKQYVANARTDLTKGKHVLADGGVPESVLWSVAFPANLTSHVLAPIKGKFKFVSSGNDLSAISQSGHLAAAMVLGDPRSAPGPSKQCGYPVTKKPATIPIVPVINYPFWMSTNYLAGSDGTVQVTAGSNTFVAPVKSGLHTLFLQTNGSYDGVTMTPLSDVSLCVDNVKVGQLSAQKSP